MFCLREQAGQRLGVGGVPGLDALGLGQAELVEEHLLQLLGRAEVELVPHHRVGGLLGRLGLAVQGRGHRREVLGVGGDPGALHLGQHGDQRHLELAQQRHRLAPVQVLLQGRGQLQRGLGAQYQGGRRVALARAVQRQLAVFGLLAQLLAQVAQRQVGQVEGALAGQRQVGGDRRVARQPGQRQAAGRERVHRAFGVVQHLRAVGVGQPGGQRLLVRLGEFGRVQVGAVAVGGGDRQAGHVPRPAPPGSRGCHPGPFGRRMGGQPGTDLIRSEQIGHHLEGRFFRPSRGGAAERDVGVRAGRPDEAVREGLVEALAEHLELERVEELVDLLPVPGHRQQVAGHRADGLGGQVGEQRGELAVAQHVAEVLAQRVAGLALDLVHPVDQGLQRAELRDPLGRGLLPHPGDAGQVVARVAADRGEVGVLRRGEPVLLGHRRRGETGHLGDAAPGHQHRHLVRDQLEHVAVAGDDEHVHVLRRGLRGQRGDEIVGLVARRRQPPDAERVEHLEDQAELAAEVLGRLAAVGLVLDVLLVPERRLAPVERHRDVRRLLVAQHVDQHRGEPVDRVGRLPGGGREVLDRQREECPVGQRMTVEQQQSVLALLLVSPRSDPMGRTGCGSPRPPPACAHVADGDRG